MNETAGFEMMGYREVALESRLSLMHERVLHVGAEEAVDFHRTPAYKLVVGVDAELVLRRGGEGAGAAETGRARVVLVPPLREHALAAPGIAVGFFLASDVCGAPRAGVSGEIEIITGRAAALLVGWAHAVSRDGGARDPACGDEAVHLLGFPRGRRVDGRVRGTLQRLGCAPGAAAAELAKAVRLSPERLRHLVAAETGVPLREHRLFARTLQAVAALMQGESVASAAAGAGFSDHAHLTRTFRRCFGRLPSNRPSRALLHPPWTSGPR